MVSTRIPFLCLTLLALAGATAVNDAAAQSRPKRCVTDSGESVRTDKPCEAFNATEQKRAASTYGAAADRRLMAARPSSYRPVCAKTIDDLSYSLSAAMDARDVNRFSSIYHWVGVSNVRAIAVLNKFERIMKRPVVDIELTGGSAGGTEWQEDADGFLTPIEHAARPPTGLRLRQQKPGGNATESTQFRFVRNFGCYWLSF